MNDISRLWRRVIFYLRRDQFDRELEEEMRLHLELKAEENVAAGMSPQEAEYAAQRQFGNQTRLRETSREMWGFRSLDVLAQDVRYGARILIQKPGFTVIAMLTLALGIGANTAIFSVINAVLLRPLPYKDPDRLAILWTDDLKRQVREGLTSYLTYADWRAESRRFAEMAIFSDNPLTLAGQNQIERAKGEFVSANLFPLLGVKPILGRTFTSAEEEARASVVVLSHGLWQRRFGGSPDVIGQKLSIDGDPTSWKDDPRAPQIIGVMPADFYFPDKQTELWEPATILWEWKRATQSDGRFWGARWGVVGRLQPDATMGQAQADMTAIGQRLAENNPVPAKNAEFAGFAVNVVPVLDQVLGKNLKLALWILLCAVLSVLLIACVNVANLSLARGVSREREFAIRAALGADRGRLLGQLLIESGMLSLVGGLVGFGLAAAGVRILSVGAPPGIPRLDEVGLDSTVMLFTVGLSLVAGLLFGLAPAWKVSRSDPNGALKENSRSSVGCLGLHQTGGLLVIIEIALGVILLIGAGLLIHSFLRFRAVDPGFNPDNVLLARVSLPPGKSFLQRGAIFQAVAERIAEVPGVQGVGAVSDFFLKTSPSRTIMIPGRPSSPEIGQLAFEGVSPGFFETMGVPLLQGRLFTYFDVEAWKQSFSQVLNDQAGSPTFASWSLPPGLGWEFRRPTPPEPVIINETFAHRFFPGEDPIGKGLLQGRLDKTYPLEIVGVVGDMHRQGLEKEAIPEYYAAVKSDAADIVVRVGSPPLKLAATIRQLIQEVEENATVVSITTVENQMGELSALRRFQTWLLTLFAILALTLAAIGIYGIMHYAVVQRTHEIGIRVALGARAPDVLRLVISQGMKVVAIGLAAGLVGALLLTRLMVHLLFGVSATDPATFVGVALLLICAALVACYLPARRATKVDPLTALRHE